MLRARLLMLAMASLASASTLQSQTIPLRVYRSLFSGSNHSCAIDSNGYAFCWGDNASGQLGAVTTESGPSGALATTPVAVGGGLRFVMLALGERHTCGLTMTAEMYCWGHSEMVGTGEQLTSTQPVKVVERGNPNFTFRSIAAGADWTCAIPVSASGQVQNPSCWGARYGREPVAMTAASTMPAKVLRLTGGIGSEACGIVVASGDGSTYCWGKLITSTSNTTTMTSIGMAAQVFSSATHRCLISTTRRYSGTSTMAGGPSPSCVAAALSAVRTMPDYRDAPTGTLKILDFNAVSVGNDFACALRPTGQAYCFGTSRNGVLGSGEVRGDILYPVPVQAGALLFSAISAGYAHTCALLPAGAVYCWGKNDRGQLGRALSTVMSAVPLPVSGQGI